MTTIIPQRLIVHPREFAPSPGGYPVIGSSRDYASHLMDWGGEPEHFVESDERRWLTLLVTCSSDQSIASSAWDQLIRMAGSEKTVLDWLSVGPPRRILPLLGSRVHELGLSNAVADLCATATAEAWGLNQMVFETARTVLDLFDRSDIQVMAFKGLALAGEVYSPHRLRAIGDLDLLVHPRDHRRAVRLLEKSGWSRDPSTPRPVRGAATSALGRPGMTCVDLHSRPARNLPHRFPGEPSCWKDAECVGPDHPLADLKVLRPTPERHLVILAAHVCQAANTDLFHPLVDIHQLLLASASQRCSPIDINRLIVAADDEGARGRLTNALGLVVGHLGAPGPPSLPPLDPRHQRREARIHSADLKCSDKSPGVVSQLGRMRSNIQVSTIGQGPLAAAQVAYNVMTHRIATLRHPPRGPSRPRAPAPAFSATMVNPTKQSWFGTTDDGAVIEIESFNPAVGDLLAAVWPPRGLRRTADRPTTAPSMVIDVAGDLTAPTLVVDGDPMPNSWDALESILGLFTVERLQGLVAVHAAVLVWDGVAVIVPGASFAGKSTLTVAAAAAGATVASDEFALVDPQTGLVQGWNRRVRLRTPTGAERVDLAVDIEPTPVAVVAAISYVDGEPTLQKLSPAETAFELLANTVCAQSRPIESLAAASVLSRSVDGYKGTRREASRAADVLHDLCRGWRADR